MSRLEDHKNAVALLGQPIRHGWLVRGYLENWDNEFGAAQFRIAIKGSKDNGTLRAQLGRVEGTWVFAALQLILTNGTAIDLLESADDPPRAKLETDKRLYLVPIGNHDDFGLDQLPQFYKQKFGLDVVALAPIPLEDHVRNPKRRQLIAEEIVALMQRRLPQLAKDKNAVMIGITDEDMYFRERNWRFTYTYWDGDRGGAVSSARFRATPGGKRESVLKTRMRKMISRVIGMLVFKLPRSEDPSSVLAKELYGSFSADLMSDNFDGLGSQAVVDDFMASHRLPSLPPVIMSEKMNFDGKGVDGRYPCLLIRRNRDPVTATALFESATTKCLPQSPIDVDADELEVDLRTGRVMTRETDLFVGGAPPLAATRCYQPWDDHSRTFGYNTTLAWDMSPSGKRNPYTDVDLNLCGGHGIHFDRISEGSGYMNALFEHRQTATPFLRARFGWAGNGWNLDQADGTHMFFPESYNARRGVDGALVEFRSAKGEPVTIKRDKARNLKSLSRMDGQFIKFDYDSRNRMIKAYDRQSRTVHYTYDLAGRLVQMKMAKSARRYSYLGTYLTSIHENDQRLYRLQYARGRVDEVSLASGETYKFRYDYDLTDDSRVIRTYLTGPDRALTKFDIKPE